MHVFCEWIIDYRNSSTIWGKEIIEKKLILCEINMSIHGKTKLWSYSDILSWVNGIHNNFFLMLFYVMQKSINISFTIVLYNILKLSLKNFNLAEGQYDFNLVL